ncbi:hypothetical protein [Burkholderia savannae]|uniref:hypothetical protein n=1 Tax=Burkholderia savannae TaxID=1637837 RepID=UPI001E3CD24E|nr:hypothetical protein [Burkholderia savannae]
MLTGIAKYARPRAISRSSADSSAVPSKAAVSAIAMAARESRTRRALGSQNNRLGTEAIDASPEAAGRDHFEDAFH